MDLDAAPYEYRQTAYRPTAAMFIVSGAKKYQSTTSGAARPACLEHVGFTAHTRDICEHAQSPFLLRCTRRKYSNRTQTSGFTLVLHFSACRQRLLGTIPPYPTWRINSPIQGLSACRTTPHASTTQTPGFAAAPAAEHVTSDSTPQQLSWVVLQVAASCTRRQHFFVAAGREGLEHQHPSLPPSHPEVPGGKQGICLSNLISAHHTGGLRQGTAERAQISGVTTQTTTNP
ncbi:hypothetical protein Anapl_01167 [Anas platyrhynchos]|uniref:Uncharacterized protein n=1 Tax=Anas platyrhynchos TaxID=8839 RepID=R0LVU7_ANAPL|nr:hypothetical protein Anapl_01167 [Anas platyrhynchos]